MTVNPSPVIPSPGSSGALEQGCTCPILDNGHGKGYMGGMKDEQGKTIFVFAEGCPLHWNRSDRA